MTADLIPHDKLKFSRAKLPFGIAQIAVVSDTGKI